MGNPRSRGGETRATRELGETHSSTGLGMSRKTRRVFAILRAVEQLRRLWHGWTRIGRKIGDFQARVLLTAFYFVIMAPVALIVRIASDPLAVNATTTRGWRPRPAPTGGAVDRARRQF